MRVIQNMTYDALAKVDDNDKFILKMYEAFMGNLFRELLRK